MKVIYPICAGIDVHKKSFTIAVNSTKKDDSYTVRTKTFTTMYDDILRAREWLLENHFIDVAMESTGSTGFLSSTSSRIISELHLQILGIPKPFLETRQILEMPDGSPSFIELALWLLALYRRRPLGNFVN